MEDSISAKRWYAIAAFCFGVVFVIAVLVLVFLVPNPSGAQYTIMRIVLALAAAGVAAVLTGFLDVKFRTWLRAGGGLAVFVVVYFFAPAALTDNGNGSIPPAPAADPQLAAVIWLNLLDKGDFRKAYDSTASNFRTAFSWTEFSELIKSARVGLSEPVSRTLYTAQQAVSPPGFQNGHYRDLIFRTTFAGADQPVYEDTLLYGESTEWRIVSYHLAVMLSSGKFGPYVPKFR